MNLLSVEMKNKLAKKLLFTLNFMLLNEDDIFNIFNLIVLDIHDDKVARFDLVIEDKDETHIIFKRITNGDVVLIYQLVTPGEEVINKFEIYVTSDGLYGEYHDTIKTICEMVDEKEREKQFQKLDTSLNNLLRY